MSKRALGKGLGALLGDAKTPATAPAVQHEGPPLLGGREARMIALAEVRPNPHQPRKHMGDNELEELAESIRQNGILQPILVRRAGDGFELVAGERRWRASQRAGLREIPALVCSLEEAESMKLALLENIQREDLDVIEEAEAYKAIMERYGATHEELATMLGKSRSAVTNTLRLLNLEESILTMLREKTLSMGHARALLGVSDRAARLRLARKVETEGWSVRTLEKAITGAKSGAGTKPRPAARTAEDPDGPALREFETRLFHRLGSPCAIRRRGKKGRIEIQFFSDDELERILEGLGIDVQL